MYTNNIQNGKTVINASGAIRWPNFQLVQVEPQKVLLTEDNGGEGGTGSNFQLVQE